MTGEYNAKVTDRYRYPVSVTLRDKVAHCDHCNFKIYVGRHPNWKKLDIHMEKHMAGES